MRGGTAKAPGFASENGGIDHTEVTEVTEVFKDSKRQGKIGSRSGADADNFDISSVTFATSA